MWCSPTRPSPPSAAVTSEALGVDPERDTWLACLPLAHVGGLSVVARALLTDTPLVVHDGFDASRVQASVDAGVTLVSLVATALARVETRRFRRVLLGGSAPPNELPDNVVTTYGLTETGSGVVYDGRPLRDVEVRVVDGEIHVRGPMLLRAYRDGTDPKDPDGWFATGDGGRLRDDGTLEVHGRLGDLVVTGGENVWPAAVEEVLGDHPSVAEVRRIGRDDPEWGQRVVAQVVPSDPGEPPDLDALRAWVRDRLSPVHAPRELDLVSRLPRTTSGKLRR
ncbi:MAG: AMP-binding protein [Acidimicrobiia bacterium]|nr:AMP-binding protein [Acidimicrobiia bacterium]